MTASIRRLRHRNKSKSTSDLRARRLFGPERLEDRSLLALLGIVPNYPLIFCDGRPAAINYDAGTDEFSVSAIAHDFQVSISDPPQSIENSDACDISISINNLGLVTDVDAGPDLEITGDILDDDSNVLYSGLLLTGEILAFGHQDSGTSTDAFDFRFTPTGGKLLTEAPNYFLGKHIGVTLNAEQSGFGGSFDSSFGANVAKLTIGPIEGSIKSGRKYEDMNADGSGVGDLGLAGWTIAAFPDNAPLGTLDPSDGPPVTAITDVNGNYTLVLQPGRQYIVVEQLSNQPPGWFESPDDGPGIALVNPSNPAYGKYGYVVTLDPGETESGNDFGNYRKANKTGVKFEDLDADGAPREAGEPGLGGWTIYVDYNDNGTLDGGEPSAVTSGAMATLGEYTITGINPGTWKVREVLQNGWNNSFPADSDAFGRYHLDTFTSGETEINNDFGNWRTANKKGVKFEDLDADGAPREADEPGLGGWTIYVDYDDDGMLDGNEPSAVTSGAMATLGEYTITGINPGTWKVREVLQGGGWINSFPATSDAKGRYHLDTFDSGETEFNNDFGNWKPGTKSGKKFEDVDGDGKPYEMDEPLLDGWVINAYADNNPADGVLSSDEYNAGAVATDTTDVGTGAYSLTLNPGRYIVCEVMKVDDDWSQTFPNDLEDGDGIVNSVCGGGFPTLGPSGYAITMTSRGNHTNNDFGNHRPDETDFPDIDIEKSTDGPTNSNPIDPDYDNEDAENGPGVPQLTPGSTVTWTYKVTNTGNVPFNFAEPDQLNIVDDNGTPGNLGDDLSTANGLINFQSVLVGDADTNLEPGEVWLYQATGTVQVVGSAGSAVTFDFSGSDPTSGTAGNTKTYSDLISGIDVKASAFSRASDGTWATAYLGAYGGGLGVTDASEGSGGSNSHTVDNIGRNNYVLFEFSEKVIVDSAFLGYVVSDSDLTYWIGTKTDPFNNHEALLSDAYLASLGFTEDNLTVSTTTRTADLNAGNVAGNVLVIAAWTGDLDPEDQFKIENAIVRSGCYENKAVVAAPGTDGDSDLSHYCNNKPGIDIEKKTNATNPANNKNPIAPDYDNEDSENGPGVPLLAPGTPITWTYQVTNTGNVAFPAAQVVVVDDNGTPGNAGDDIFPVYSSGDVLTPGILSPGEIWIYTATGVAQNVGAPGGGTATFDFSGSSGTDGADGNERTFTANGVSVKATAFSRDSGGAWQAAFLGSYGGGLGVTDTSEGDGSNDTHTVDNVGRNNYVLLRFDQNVVVDEAFLGYVVNDSDVTAWVGTIPNAYTSSVTLSDAVLSGLILEDNLTNLTSTRTVDLNSGNVSGNVLVIAAWTGDPDPEDRFKLEKVTVDKHGCYENRGTVTVPGDEDSDLSHYCNPPAIEIDKFVKIVEGPVCEGEGLTPGFWKTHSQYGPAPLKGWPETGYNPNDTYQSKFGVLPGISSSLTLLNALNAGGGGINALLRHSTAALLNSAHPTIEYSFTTAQVISMTQTAILSGDPVKIESTKNKFEEQNEKGADLTQVNCTPGGSNSSSYGSDSVVASTGDKIVFTYIVTNPGDVPLTISNIFDNMPPGYADFNPTQVTSGGFNVGDLNQNNRLDPDPDGSGPAGEKWRFTSAQITVGLTGGCNTVTVTGKSPTNIEVQDADTACWETQDPDVAIDIEKYVRSTTTGTGKGEGLTPGFWKQSQHFYAWTGYTQGQSYNTVFGVSDPDNPTLLGALQRGGGENNALGRHAVAALLNASNPNIDYAYTTQQIISMVQTAYSNNAFETIKNLLASENEKGANLTPSSTITTIGSGYGFDADESTGPTRPTFPVGNQVIFTLVVTNPGKVALENVVVTDNRVTVSPVLDGSFNIGDDDQDNQLDPGETWLYTATEAVASGCYTNVASVTGKPVGMTGSVSDSDPANYCGGTVTPPTSGIDIEKYVKQVSTQAGGEGLTPGFWKQDQHFYAWTAPYSPTNPASQFNLVFGVNDPDCPTLLEALKTGGGGYNALGRHAVAALLNAANPNIDYAYTVTQIINMVKAAYANSSLVESTKDNFAKENEKGADLTSSASTSTVTGYGLDADTSPGLSVMVGNQVLFTYIVTNTGQAALAPFYNSGTTFVTSSTGAQYPAPVLKPNSTKNIGDCDDDGLLDPGEVWKYTQVLTVSTAGQFSNIGTAKGKVVDATGNPTSTVLTDQDSAYWLGYLPTKFYVVNDGSTSSTSTTVERTYEYTETGTPVENYLLNSGNTRPRGAASNAAGTKIWVVDANRNVYVYDPSGNLLKWWKTNLPTDAIAEGIATNGTDIWIVDNKLKKVYKFTDAANFSGTNGTTVNSSSTGTFTLNSSNSNPKGIVTDGVYIWVVNDASTDKVFRYTVGGSNAVSWAIDSANKTPTDLTIDPAGGKLIWIVDAGTDKVYQYNNARDKTSGSLSATTSFALAAGNTNPQGIADPPPADPSAVDPAAVDAALLALLPASTNSKNAAANTSKQTTPATVNSKPKTTSTVSTKPTTTQKAKPLATPQSKSAATEKLNVASAPESADATNVKTKNAAAKKKK